MVLSVSTLKILVYLLRKMGKMLRLKFIPCLKVINMSGFRVGFAVGNKDMIQALKSTKRTQMLGCLVHYKMPQYML